MLKDDVVNLLLKKELTITAAESLTGGLFQATIASIPKVSNVFYGGFVTYSNTAKTQLLNISKETIDKYGVVSENIAKEMAQNSRRIMKTDIGISFTGVAGPDSLEDKSAGTVWIGLSTKKGCDAYLYNFSGNRNEVRNASVRAGLEKVISWLEKS